MAGYLAGLVNPATTAAAVVLALAAAANPATSELNAYNKALVSTGGASGRSAAELVELQAQLANGKYFSQANDALMMVKDLRFHDIRHEGTSRLFEKGLSIMEVASIAGHKTMSMLMRYTGPATESHIAAVEKGCEGGRLRQTMTAAMAWGRQRALDWITESFPPAPTGLEVKPSGRRPSRTSR